MALKNIDPLSLDETNDENKDDSKEQEKSVSLWEHEALSQVTRICQLALASKAFSR